MTRTRSPVFTGRSARNLPTYSPVACLNTCVPSGTSTMRCAGTASTTVSVTFSPITVPALLRVNPSICTAWLPRASRKAGITLAAVVFFPVIWRMLPTLADRRWISAGSSRANPRPTSGSRLSATLSGTLATVVELAMTAILLDLRSWGASS